MLARLTSAVLVASAGASTLIACKGSTAENPSARTEWLVDPKTAPIPDAYVSGQIEGSPVKVRNVSFFSETDRWDVRIEGSDASSNDVIVNLKLHEPVVAGKTYVLDRIAATGTSVDVTDPATKKNRGESNLTSIVRLQVDRWDAKPYAGHFDPSAGFASGRIYVGLQSQDGKQGGLAGTFAEAKIGYLAKPPGT